MCRCTLASRVSGVARSTTRPSRSCRSAKHPARSASTSTSPSYHWSFSPPYIHTQLRCLAHHVSDCELPIPHDRTAMALFSAARSTSPRPQSPKSVVGRVRSGFAQLGVSRRGCGFVVCASRSLRGAKKHRTAALFLCFSRESPPHAHPDRRPDICHGFCRPAGLRSPEFHFGHFASRAWRLLGGHQKKVRFSLCCASALGSFLIPLFGTNFYTRETANERPNRAKQLT